MKILLIEWQRLLDENNTTCPRCGSTEQKVDIAATELSRILLPHGISIAVEKKAIDAESFLEDTLQSNRILIAGKTLETWLGAATGQSQCCEVCGDEECRTLEYAGQTHEAIPAELIVSAGLRAASAVFHLALSRDGKGLSAIRIFPGTC